MNFLRAKKERFSNKLSVLADRIKLHIENERERVSNLYSTPSGCAGQPSGGIRAKARDGAKINLENRYGTCCVTLIYREARDNCDKFRFVAAAAASLVAREETVQRGMRLARDANTRVAHAPSHALVDAHERRNETRLLLLLLSIGLSPRCLF